MESNDSYPVFHTRLTQTLRRRLTWPDGTSPGWLILSTDQLTDVPAEPLCLSDAIDELHRDDPPQVAIPHPR